MTESAWHNLGPLTSLSDGSKTSKNIAGEYILILRIGDQIFAYEDRCPHTGAPLVDGRFQNKILTCRHHQWQFDACTGKSLRPQGHKIKSFAVKIEDGVIFVHFEKSVSN